MNKPNPADMTIEQLLAELAERRVETSVHGKAPQDLSRYALELEVSLARRPKMPPRTVPCRCGYPAISTTDLDEHITASSEGHHGPAR